MTNRKYATIGLDLYYKTFKIDGKNIRCFIDEPNRRDRFGLDEVFYRGSDGCVLVYDISNINSLDMLEKWKNEFCKHLNIMDPEDYPFLLLGNKADLPQKNVQNSISLKFAQMNGIKLFYEVSAQTGENVQIAMESIIRQCIKKRPPIPDEFEILPLPASLDTENNNSCSYC